MKNNFKPLGSILQNIVQKHHLENEYNFFKLEREWANILDAQIADIAKPHSLDGKILTVKVETQEWRKEIKKYQQEIVKKINENMQDFEIDYLNII
jgi:predicted nucleic acid-binding Zn ribbon protein